MTWLGGACCTPNAERKSESTTTILRNEVKIMMIKGNNDNSVRRTACVINEGRFRVDKSAAVTFCAGCAPVGEGRVVVGDVVALAGCAVAPVGDRLGVVVPEGAGVGVDVVAEGAGAAV